MGSSVQALLDLVKSEAVTVRGLEADALNVLGDLHPVASVIHRPRVAATGLDQLVAASGYHPAGKILANLGVSVHTAKRTRRCAVWYSGRMNGATETRTALYRFYDAREELLYVGITDDPWRRWREHMQAKPWYPRVKHQSVTWYDTRGQAETAEKRAIRAERPQFNIAGAVRPPGARFTVSRQAVGYLCSFWIMAQPAPVLAAVLVHALAPLAIVTSLSCVVPLVMLSLMTGARWVYRFGCWLNCNFAEPADRLAHRGRLTWPPMTSGPPHSPLTSAPH